MVQILQYPVRSSVVPVSSTSMKAKVNIFHPHDVREVVLIPFFLQFSGFREDDILLEGVGEDNTMAFEEASRRRAVGKSRRAVGAKLSEIITAGPRSTSVGNSNVFTPLSGSPYPINMIAIPYAISFRGKGFHSSQAAGMKAVSSSSLCACVPTWAQAQEPFPFLYNVYNLKNIIMREGTRISRSKI